MKALVIVAAVALSLFLLSLVVYFFNLDMKLAAKLQPIFLRRYGRLKRDRRL
ncbi:MAG: hypothetical protein JNG85_12740 [Spirochaetaceae bacterium]|nr:hypothetical protein [Spirochaetaceae bacterium]